MKKFIAGLCMFSLLHISAMEQSPQKLQKIYNTIDDHQHTASEALLSLYLRFDTLPLNDIKNTVYAVREHMQAIKNTLSNDLSLYIKAVTGEQHLDSDSDSSDSDSN